MKEYKKPTTDIFVADPYLCTDPPSVLAGKNELTGSIGTPVGGPTAVPARTLYL